MSVQTEADRLLDLVRGRINDATVAMGEIVVKRAVGYNDYNEKFKNTLKEVLTVLIEMRERLS